jgi:hypothetical protein
MRRIPAFFGCICSKEQLISAFLLVSIFASQISFIGSFIPKQVDAAVVTIDSTVSATAAAHLFAGSQSVFVSDQVGYKFYVDSTGACVYSKTTNGGTSWGAQVTVDAQTDCFGITVWYDQWTTGDYGSYIHIATLDTSQSSLWYNRLDTNTDTLLMGSAPTSTSLSLSPQPTLSIGVNSVSITKGTDGVLYMVTSDASASFVVSCSVTCNLASSWARTGTSFMDLANDFNLLIPLPSGSILLIDRSFTSPNANNIRSRVWNGSTWSASWNVFDTAVPSQTYDVGMSAVVDQSTGDVLLVYAADNDNYTTLDHDVRTAKYVSGSWTLTAPLFTNSTRGLDSVAIARDTNLGTVYVAYSIRSTPATATTGNVYYATSTSAMSSWGSEQGPVNAAASDLFGLDLNIMNDERIYATWENPAAAQRGIYGNTIADIAPATKVQTLGTPTTTVIASTTNVYAGGTFAIKETQASRNVTDIVVTESGTIDGSANVKNVKLLYDLDTVAPYDCASDAYSGSEAQFGATDSNGFSGANGVASFNGLVNISPTQAMCVYVVLDVLDSAADGSTLKLTINNPPADILVTGGSTVKPLGPAGFVASTTIKNDRLTQSHFHFRNDNGTEITASSTTGGVEDTAIAAISVGTPKRLRIEVSNKGSITSPASQFRLEYAEAAPSCSTATGWTDVNATNDAWNMFNSAFLTNGSNTTDIAVASGGVTNDNLTFLVANGGVLDATSQSGALTLSSTTFAELEYSIVASSSAVQGTTYCFRVTDAGTPLPAYNVYPSATVSADVTLSSIGTQTATVTIPTTGAYFGGAFVFKENTGSHAITNIAITENGTVDASADLKNVKLRYDVDITAPYDCASESYSGSEAQYGATATSGFGGPNGSSTFSDSVTVTTTQALCVYVIADVGTGALNGQTIQIEMSNGGDDAVVSGGSIAPSTPVLISGTTTFAGAVLAQTGFHFRNDNGSEATATSKTAGIENTTLLDHPASTSVRVRLAVSNTGSATSTATQYRLEFGPKITTCSAVSVWTGVGDTYDDWNMSSSSFLVNGADTTNIATTTGGITDPNTTFLTPNGGVRVTTSTTSSITLSPTQFTELEFSIMSSGVTAYNTTYCFRVTSAGTPLVQYTNYAEIKTAAKRDFKVQRGDTTVTGTGTVLVAGVDYTAPSATSSSFIRITNADNTGAGKDTLGGAQNARDVTAYISNPGNLLTSVTLARPTAALNNTRVSWEIVEFVADPGTDNEMKVRTASTIQMAAASSTATGTAVSGIIDNSKVVVYITGVNSREAARNAYYAAQVTASWNATTHQPVFDRGASGQIIDISYAVVEYTGINWNVQRIEHTYSATGTVETQAMNPVNSLARTFTHVQKRMTAQGNVNNFGHEVWLSSIGAISFELEPGATAPSGHTSVVWVIENQQTSAGAMKVQRYGQNTTDGTEPVSIVSTFSPPVAATNNTSITVNARSAGANTNFPLPNAGASLTSTSSYTIWRSEATAGLLTYRTEVIEWPTNGLAVRQNYYQIYEDNNALTPTVPWAGLGENTAITATDAPPGEGEHMRLRMSVRVSNANLPAGLYSYKLQYGLRASSSCTAISSWTDVGAPGSGAIWRGYDATGTTDGTNVASQPPTIGQLRLSVSDTSGSYVEQNPSPANPYAVSPGNDYEYDWHIQHNGALERSTYCFRMTQSDGTTLDGYLNYPQIRTASFSPVSKNWHWYDDATSTTPTVSLASENVAPTQIVNSNGIVLRTTIGELKHVLGQNIKFKLQFDESPMFTSPHDVVATSSCAATSTWCYATQVGSSDNATITARVMSDSDTCSLGVGNGCGTHNTSPTFVFGKTHAAGANAEYAFYIQNAGARVGAVYYFRLYDIYNDLPVSTSTGAYSYPSLVAESSTLDMSVAGLPVGTTTAGITTTATATPSTITFGSIPINTDWYAAQRITVTTNASEGYQVLGFARGQLINGYGTAIPSITGTNAVPVSWAIGCTSTSTGCIGYHTTDATLANNSTRFSPLDSYSGLETAPKEILYSSISTTDVHDIVYRVKVGTVQPSGLYQTEIVYLAIPIY